MGSWTSLVNRLAEELDDTADAERQQVFAEGREHRDDVLAHGRDVIESLASDDEADRVLGVHRLPAGNLRAAVYAAGSGEAPSWADPYEA